MARLENNSIVKTVLGESVQVINKLGEGGQGTVYEVKWRDNSYALKWYHRGGGKNADKFYENLKQNVEKGSPASTFLWPLAITEKDNDGCFGYVMKLIPNEYKDFSQFLLNRVKFSNTKAFVNAALLITVSLQFLHNEGLSYQNLNDGNFFINPDDGDILICDNDSVAPDGEHLEYSGVPGFVAPEVLAQNHMPDAFSDRFSLAVILFKLFFKHHPLIGKCNDNCTTFIFDPNDDSNRPVPGIHNNPLKLWPLFPPFIQDLFIRAFDKSLMKEDGSGRQNRINENEWLQQLVRLHKSIVLCPHCNNETLYEPNELERPCVNCGYIFNGKEEVINKNEIVTAALEKLIKFGIL